MEELVKQLMQQQAQQKTNKLLTQQLQYQQQMVLLADTVHTREIAPPTNQSEVTHMRQTLKQQSSESTEAKPQLNPAATSFYPGTSHPFTPGSPYAPGASRVVVATSGEKSDMSEFARFMVSRELINTSLTKFDDRAESYRAWKATFKAAIANLNLTAEQELDLMIKWLGPGSKNRIKSLRTVYVGQAEAGIAAAWQRLERTFGSAEAIEKALFKRLQDIPKINLKEVHKLQDLSDLLMELELAKRDPRLSGLCYLDTAHGVNPIVVKLPYSLQEKWATSVSRYKRMHDVTFPPFIQFCKFIDEQIIPWTERGKIKGWIFDGPHIGKLMNGSKFITCMNDTETSAWNSFVSVVKNCLGNHRVDNSEELV
ncbi:uncharacterized protein ACNLHF_021263 [Anomaloglossus baeobatrachus]